MRPILIRATAYFWILLQTTGNQPDNTARHAGECQHPVKQQRRLRVMKGYSLDSGLRQNDGIGQKHLNSKVCVCPAILILLGLLAGLLALCVLIFTIPEPINGHAMAHHSVNGRRQAGAALTNRQDSRFTKYVLYFAPSGPVSRGSTVQQLQANLCTATAARRVAPRACPPAYNRRGKLCMELSRGMGAMHLSGDGFQIRPLMHGIFISAGNKRLGEKSGLGLRPDFQAVDRIPDIHGQIDADNHFT